MAAQPRKAPLHVPIAIGAAGGLYAITLAAVAALQSSSDAALAASRQPMRDALATERVARDAFTTDLNATIAALNAASGAYAGSAQGSGDFEAAVADLARQVQAATGAAAQVPASMRLPSAPRLTTVVGTAPATHATTGASGLP